MRSSLFTLTVSLYFASYAFANPCGNDLVPRAKTKISPDNTCGGTKGYVCGSSNSGLCCSKHGWCGKTSDYCGTGCQSAFGTCSGTVVTTSTSAASPSSSSSSSSGDSFLCGPSNGNKSCQQGYCCSQYGYCGNTSDYCGTGCNTNFGTCSSSVQSTGTSTSSTDKQTTSTTSTTSSASSSPTADDSITCGPQNGNKPCLKGYCCAASGYCGNTIAHCASGCQTGFGRCFADVPVPTTYIGNTNSTSPFTNCILSDSQHCVFFKTFSTISGCQASVADCNDQAWSCSSWASRQPCDTLGAACMKLDSFCQACTATSCDSSQFQYSYTSST